VEIFVAISLWILVVVNLSFVLILFDVGGVVVFLLFLPPLCR